MFQKPSFFAPENAEVFKHRSIAAAYHHRPPYPAEVFTILAGLIHTAPRRVLDVGSGTGNIARNLIEHVESIDAVDFSLEMMEQGKQLPKGDHPHLHWLYGPVEEVALHPPYALVTAGESLHWMDWDIVLPRFHEVLLPGSYLAIVDPKTTPDPWSSVSEITARYSTNKGTIRNMVDELEQRGLFQKVGEKVTTPVAFIQSIDDYIEAYHSRSGFSRERMGMEQAQAFDEDARKILLKTYPQEVITLQVAGRVVWGIPGRVEER
jgi:ubiquinone/menaquinone biosynthesis C-methylase UbiE